MNAWNQWGAAAYPTPIPGYGAPQTAGAPAIPTAAGLPSVAAAAAVPYPAMPGFQAWPYAAAPQAMTPWGTPGAAAPAGQAAAAQWDQWNQWHQQYSQWQQHYAAQSVANTPQTSQAHTTIATPKAGMISQVQAVAGATAPTIATTTTATPAAASSGNVKRAQEAPAEQQTESKKQRMEQPGWNQQGSTPSTTSKELEELSEAEKQFDEQFKSWESQFDTWRQQNANHPDIEQYKAYEAKWASWREQLLARREQMKKKREKLTEAAASSGKAEPLSQPPDPLPVMGPSAAAPIPMYPGYVAPSTTAATPVAPQYPSPYQQPQSQFMTHYIAPSTPIPQPTKTPTTTSSAPSSSGASEPSPSQHSEFLKSSSSNGIPGLDLLSGGTSQAEVKSMPAVSFASTGQLPIQTPADSKPFDFPPPRQGPGGQGSQPQQGFPNHQAQGNVPGQSPGGMSSGGYPGLMTPGFPPGGFPNQSQGGAGFQGPSQTGGYPGGFPPQNSGGYQNQAAPSGGFPQGGQTPGFQGAPTSGFQPGAPPASGFQVQAPTSGFQQPSGGVYPFLGQPPPGGFPMGYTPSTPYNQGGFQQTNAPPQQGGFPNQPGQPSGFPDPPKGNFPFQQSPGGGAQGPHQQYPSGMGLDSKKLPGLMDNVMPPNYSERPGNRAEVGGETKRPGGPSDVPYQNKFPERFGEGNRDRFGDKPPPRFAEQGYNEKDVGYSMPKPKGYFSMQEMSEEEEYEKFHEYQQAIEDEDDEDKDGGRRSRFNDPKSKGFDDSRNPRFERPTRFDEGKSRFDESRNRDNRYDDSKSSRFDDGKTSRFDGVRPSRFDGARPTRFEDPGPNRFPPDDRSRENDNFKRRYENDPQVPPPSMGGAGNIAQTSPNKAGRVSRWGAPEPEPEREPPSVARSGDKRPLGGGLGPPYGATPDGLDFYFATIIDYNHSPANLGVPDYFEPLSVIDYTHGLNGIKVEESKKDQWDNKGRGNRGASPRSWDRDDRGNFENRSPWADDRSGGPRGPGPLMGPGGPHMGPGGPHMGPGGPHMGPGGPHMGPGGPHMGPGGPEGIRGGSEGQRGPPDLHRDGPRDGQRGPPDAYRDGQRGTPDVYRDGQRGAPDIYRDGPRGPPDVLRDGQRGPPDSHRDGPRDGQRGPPDSHRDGPRDGQRGPPDSHRDGPRDGQRGPPDSHRDGPRDGQRGPPDSHRDGPREGQRGPPDVHRDGPRDGQRGPPDVHRDGQRGGDGYRGGDVQRGGDGQRGGRPPRWGDLDDRDRRRRDDSSSDNRSRSPDRGRQSDRMSGRDDRRDRKEPDRDRMGRDRSPIKEIMQPVPGPPQISEKQIIPIDDILCAPGRLNRPPKLAIFMRGPPGSGKSYLAKLIKDKEVKNGGTAPRILSLDDYFMTDVEKEVVDPDTGRTVKKKIMEYEYEVAMEQKYRDSLNKCFRKTVTDGYFPFIIIDANNDKLSYFDSMVNFCKVRGFAFYMVEMEQDASQCVKRNIHKRSEKDILAIIKGYEESSNGSKILDVRSLLQEASIPEVDMEDSMDTAQSDETQDKPESQEETKPDEPPASEQNQQVPPSDDNSTEPDKDDNKAAERTGFARFTISSKWDDLDSSCSKLDRLDGFTSARKPRPTIQDWLQIPDETSFVSESTSVGSKKRVRWADVEERSKQAKMKAMGFVVGHTDWNRMLDPTSGQSKLTQTKYI